MSDITGNIEALERQLARSGGSAEGYHELGRLKLHGGDANGSAAAYAMCLTYAPRSAEVRNNYGIALIRAGRFDEAIVALETALRQKPGYVRALVNLGKALPEAGRPVDATCRLTEALAIQADYVPALINIGEAHAAAGDLGAALQALERAVQLAPTLVEALSSLGMARLQAGQVPEALETLSASVALAPEHADAHSNLAHALFCSGDWQAAWPHFEYRFQRHAHRTALRPPSGASRWDGVASPEIELWVLGEQGLGDQLQFVRYIRVLRNHGMRCVLACDLRLRQILTEAGLGAHLVTPDTPPDATAVRWIPLLSLPAWHRTQPETVPAPDGYLAADVDRVARWRARLPAAPKLRVALAWTGNPAMETGRYAGRSPPLAALAPLMGVPNVQYISLQKGAGTEQLDREPFGASILRFPDLDEGPHAFLDTAAILKSVDLLVTSDTAIAHLAGALGVRCWLCLMHEPDWRWMRRGANTPWYSSMRLFRQTARGDWRSVFTAVAEELALLASQR